MPFQMSKILSRLKIGDRRSIGNADEVARKISSDKKLFAEVFDAMLSPEPLMRMRAADAVEKATREHPELLRPFKSRLFRQIALIEQQEARWHVALMLPRLKMTPTEVDLAGLDIAGLSCGQEQYRKDLRDAGTC